MNRGPNHRLHLNLGGLTADLGWISLNKKKEPICGDYFYIAEENDRHTLVLSDGLGSGVKANVLSTLTARMLGRMIAGHVPARDAVQAVMDTLPVCSERHLAYATFTVLNFQNDTAHLLQYDNPDAILIRDGNVEDYPIYTSVMGNKTVHESFLQFREEDMLILMSDGVTNAGMGTTNYSGWGREDVVKFCRRRYEKGMSAREMAYRIADAGVCLNMEEVEDDLTVLVLRFCRPQTANLMIGPPKDPDHDQAYMEQFFRSPGMHLICGGTTGHIAAKHLGRELKMIQDSGTEEIPCAMRLDGVDYLTEGQITLEKALSYCRQWNNDPLPFLTAKRWEDPAVHLLNLLFMRSTDINIFFGNAQNEGQTSLGLSSEGKRGKVEELIGYLRDAGKNVQITYWAA